MKTNNGFGLLLIVLTLTIAPCKGGLVDGFFQKAFDQLRPGLKDIYREEIITPHLTLRDLNIVGLDEFYAVQLNVNLLPLKLNNLTIIIDEVTANATYKMDMMSLPGDIVVSGAGSLQLNITGIRLYTQSTLGSKGGKIFIRDIIEVELTVNTLDVWMGGIEGGGPVGELIANIMQQIAGRVFNMVASNALMDNRATLIPMINDVLMKIDV